MMNTSYQTLILKKNDIFEELRKVKYNGLGNLVYRMRLGYDEIIDILDLKDIPTKRTRYSLFPGISELDDLKSIFEYIFYLIM